MNETIVRRLTRLGCLLILIFLSVAAGLFYRESSWQEKTHGHEDREERLRLAVSAIRRAPTRDWATDYRDSKGVANLCGSNDSCRYDLRSDLHRLDSKLQELMTSGRLNGRYYLDLDTLVKYFEEKKLPLSGVSWAVRRLANDRLLSVVDWQDDRGAHPGSNSIRNAVVVAELPTGAMRERNPWGAIPGRMLVEDREPVGGKPVCLSIARTGAERPDGSPPLASVVSRYPSCRFSAMAELEYLLLPWLNFDAARSAVDRNNRLIIGRNAVPVGYDAVLTFDPLMQALSAIVTEETANSPLVSRVALVVMDIATGEILSFSLAGEPLEETNPLFLEFPPASTVKVILAAALLEEAARLEREKKAVPPHFKGLPQALKVSDTDWFRRAALDFDEAILFKRSAERFGWNSDCGSSGGVGGMMDLMFGRSNPGKSKPGPLIGRAYVNPQKGKLFKMISDINLEGTPSLNILDKVIRDNKKPQGVSRQVFEAAKLVKIQTAGQGDTRTSLFGELLLISHVARTVNGKTDVPMPHMVRRLLTANGAPLATAPRVESMPAALSPQSGKALAGYLTQVNGKGGTAGEEFRKVFGRYAEPGEMIIGKTGTTDLAHSVPYRLYVSAFARKPGGTAYDTALISVVQHTKEKGVDVRKALGGGNLAAEMGLKLVRQLRNGETLTAVK